MTGVPTKTAFYPLKDPQKTGSTSRSRSGRAADKTQRKARQVPFPTAADLAPRNFDLSRSYIVRSLNSTANKALHLGHLRNVVLGAATAGTLEALGSHVIRHCVIEDTGRFMTEAMVAVENHERFGASLLAMKPDHYIGVCYAQYRRERDASSKSKRIEAGTGYEARNDAADTRMRQLARGEEEARAIWRRVRDMALTGQQATLQRLGVRFDCCDYESAEECMVDAFIADGLGRGIFARKLNGELTYTASNGWELRLVNHIGLPEESTRLLSFIRRLVAGTAAGRINIIMAGSEWKGSMGIYPELIDRLDGGGAIYDLYAQAFYGMVNFNGKKMASSTGSGVLIDDLLDQLAAGASIDELVRSSLVSVSHSGLAAMVLKSFFLSRARAEAIDFDLQRLYDHAANPGWQIAAAWASAGGASSSPPSQDASQTLFSGLCQISYEEVLHHLSHLAEAILARAASVAEVNDFRSLVTALCLDPARSDFQFSQAAPLAGSTEASQASTLH